MGLTEHLVCLGDMRVLYDVWGERKGETKKSNTVVSLSCFLSLSIHFKVKCDMQGELTLFSETW